MMAISKFPYGTLHDGRSVDLYTLESGDLKVAVTNYGGIITSILVPDLKGDLVDVVHSFDTLEEYLRGHPYFGCIVGRYANRIAHGQFTLDGFDYKLAQNDGSNHLHGGKKGFDKVLWDVHVVGDSLKFNYTSPEGEEGYPGELKVIVDLSLNSKNELSIEYLATTESSTIVNLTNHTYFNLAGHGDILEHELMMDADYFTPIKDDLIPTGKIQAVTGTPLNFLKPTKIGSRIDESYAQIQNGKGYDHNWVINGAYGRLRHAATLRDPASGRVLEVKTTQPGLQFYSGNFLDGSLSRGRRTYTHRSGLCLETQHFPDSPNHGGFPSTVLRKGEIYHEKTVYIFSAG